MSSPTIEAQTTLASQPRTPNWQSSGLRYYKYSHFLKSNFGKRVHRVTVDGGFTCPNVDGTVAVGGCVYCDNRSFSPNRREARISVTHQVSKGIEIIDSAYEPDAYLAYFQAGTNTYAGVEKLRRLYDEAIANPKTIGLIVGTRPDCVPDEVLDLLESYAKRMFVSVEYGLQTIHDRSLVWMNRGHDSACFFEAVDRTIGRGIDICAHVIMGLPGESTEDMMATINALAQTPVDGVKIHNLHVVKDTPLEEQYARGEVPILERDEYLDLLIRWLERLPQRMVIHRVTGDAPRDYLIAPQWVHRKAEFLQLLDAEMTRRNTYQGRLCDSNDQGTAKVGN